MNVTVEEKPVTAPKRSLAEIIASVKQGEPREAPIEEVSESRTAAAVEPPRRRVKRAANGTRRFKNVMIKLEPEMIGNLDQVAESMRSSRSELIRQAVERTWLTGRGRKQ